MTFEALIDARRRLEETEWLRGKKKYEKAKPALRELNHKLMELLDKYGNRPEGIRGLLHDYAREFEVTMNDGTVVTMSRNDDRYPQDMEVVVKSSLDSEKALSYYFSDAVICMGTITGYGDTSIFGWEEVLNLQEVLPQVEEQLKRVKNV